MGIFIIFLYSYLQYAIQFGLCSSIGQMFILYTVRYFPPLVLSTITTTRKFFSILLSVLFMGNSINKYQVFFVLFHFIQWLGVFLVFFGIFFDSFQKNKKKSHGSQICVVVVLIFVKRQFDALSANRPVGHLLHGKSFFLSKKQNMTFKSALERVWNILCLAYAYVYINVYCGQYEYCMIIIYSYALWSMITGKGNVFLLLDKVFSSLVELSLACTFISSSLYLCRRF